MTNATTNAVKIVTSVPAGLLSAYKCEIETAERVVKKLTRAELLSYLGMPREMTPKAAPTTGLRISAAARYVDEWCAAQGFAFESCF